MNVKYFKRAYFYIRVRSIEFFQLSKNYNIKFAFWSSLWWFCFYLRPPFNRKLSTFSILRKTDWINKYIEINYSETLKEFVNKPPQTELIQTYYIWVFWGQGYEKMPPLIRACHRQLISFNDNVQLITMQNVHHYIDLPSVIYEKVRSGKISWAHFSDIVRNTLLAKYGGLWLDATIWVSGKLPIDDLINMPIYSANVETWMQSKYDTRFWSMFDYNWNSWCLWSNSKNNLLFSFVSKMLIEFAQKEKIWFDYVYLDYLIYYATQHFSSVQSDFKQIFLHNPNWDMLAKKMNTEFNEKEYNRLIEHDFVFKLSFRTPWNLHTADNKLTYYGRILNDIITPSNA